MRHSSQSLLLGQVPRESMALRNTRRRLNLSRVNPEAAVQLCEEAWHDFDVHVRQPVVAALESVGKFRVLEAEAVKDRRLEVVDVDFVLRDVVAEFVGLAVGGAGLHAATGHPEAETMRMMIAAEEF